MIISWFWRKKNWTEFSSHQKCLHLNLSVLALDWIKSSVINLHKLLGKMSLFWVSFKFSVRRWGHPQPRPRHGPGHLLDLLCQVSWNLSEQTVYLFILTKTLKLPTIDDNIKALIITKNLIFFVVSDSLQCFWKRLARTALRPRNLSGSDRRPNASNLSTDNW